MNFCSNCGAKVTQAFPEGDDRLRYVCNACHRVHYENPKIITGCVAHQQGKILLCRRGIAPGYGLWSLPAGYLENDETTQQGAIRECREEAGATLQLHNLYNVINLPEIHEVYLLYRAEVVSLSSRFDHETLEVALFDENSLPWEDLAFQQLEPILRQFFSDHRLQCFPTRNLDISSRPMGRNTPESRANALQQLAF